MVIEENQCAKIKFSMWKVLSKEKEKSGEEIVEKHGLYNTKMEEITCCEALKFVMGFKFQHVCSMNMGREFGFLGYMDTLKSIGMWLERLRNMKILPWKLALCNYVELIVMLEFLVHYAGNLTGFQAPIESAEAEALLLGKLAPDMNWRQVEVESENAEVFDSFIEKATGLAAAHCTAKSASQEQLQVWLNEAQAAIISDLVLANVIFYFL
ncbi:conserved hypothetical protein [Ricinus communis]|uniref:Uncharacterized protein n=1 Tax=Ricinus communis TaxID=3988 RepID=B9RZM3_RICCO|nr:conserved hypothetical protein [Ricinus communis]